MAPFANLLHPGTLVYFLVFLLIGMAFGAILEMSGFGDSRKLAAQFYFKDLTVLKVMFTGHCGGGSAHFSVQQPGPAQL